MKQGQGSLVQVDSAVLKPSQGVLSPVLMQFVGRDVVLLPRNIEFRSEDNYSWFGKVQGDDRSSAVFTVSGRRIYGHVDFDGVSYEIEPTPGGHVLVESTAAPTPSPQPDAITPGDFDSRSLSDSVALQSSQEDGARIDLLVLYTQQFQDHYAGDVGTVIQHFIDVTNTAYQNSGISTRMRVVHTALYQESGAAEATDTCTAVSAIRGDSAVTQLRDTHSADLVTLLRLYQNGRPCGCGYVMNSVSSWFAGYAFSVVEVRLLSEANPYYCHSTTLAHETGHNLGCDHDLDHAGGSRAFPYSYGYDLPGLFATIMSYDSPTITYFSTPLVTYSGQPIGKDESQSEPADNARTINNTRVTAANFRYSPPADPRPTANSGPDQSVREGVPVSLDGSFSAPSTGGTLVHSWFQLSGPQVLLSSPTAARPTFTAPVLPSGTSQQLVFQLVVFESTTGSLPDTVTVNVLPHTFADVPVNHLFYSYVEKITARQVTAGCGPVNYCPDSGVTRAQMAIFLERSLRGSTFLPGSPTGMFADVGTGHWAAAWIEQLATDGITAGCGGGNYCPESVVTRAQMAVFLLKSKYGASYVPPSPTGVFGDVPMGHWAGGWIEKLAADGITAGCGPAAFCPDLPVTRGQMAVFLSKTFGF